MAASSALAVRCVALLALLALAAAAATRPGPKEQRVLCFDAYGAEYNDMIRCPNSAYCCPSADQCQLGGLCSTSEPNLLFRAPCVHENWQGCTSLCHYQTTKLLPFVRNCTDGSLCCDDDGALGQQCCANNRGAVLNARGKIATHNKPTAPVTTLPASTFPSSLQPTRGAGTTVLPAAVDNGDVTDSPQPATATVTATPSTAPPSPAGLPAGAVAGIAVAATVVGVATLTALAWLILRRRRKAREHGSGHGAGDGRSPFGRRAIDGGEMDATAESRELDSKMTPGVGQLDPKARPGTGELDAKAKLEARGLDPAKGHSLASHELDGSPVSPAELQRVSEMSVP